MLKKVMVGMMCGLMSLGAFAASKDFRAGYYFDVVKKDKVLLKKTQEGVAKVTKDKGYYDVVTSGPTSPATVWFTGKDTTYVYDICQAHNCMDNRMVVLYTPATQNVRGFLLNECKLYKTFGGVNMADQANLADELKVDPSLSNVCN